MTQKIKTNELDDFPIAWQEEGVYCVDNAIGSANPPFRSFRTKVK